MKKLPSFTEFLIMEAREGSKVIIFPGRYMPVHNGHIKAFEKASKEFGLPVIPIQVISKSEKSPFPEQLLNKLGEAVTKEFSFLEDFIQYPQDRKTVVPQMVKYLRELGYNPVGMACGSDREKSYIPQLNYLNSEKSDVPVTEPFGLKVVDARTSEGASGTKVREAITSDDQRGFEEMTPKSIHKFYNELKKYL